MPINIGSTAKLRNKFRSINAGYDVVFGGRRYAVVDIVYVFSCHAMQSRDACCEGV